MGGGMEVFLRGKMGIVMMRGKGDFFKDEG